MKTERGSWREKPIYYTCEQRLHCKYGENKCEYYYNMLKFHAINFWEDPDKTKSLRRFCLIKNKMIYLIPSDSLFIPLNLILHHVFRVLGLGGMVWYAFKVCYAILNCGEIDDLE